MAEIHGTCSDRFSGVRDVLSQYLDSGADIGASAAVFVEGEPVVDIWGGFADPDFTKPWERDTITHVFSLTKTMTAISALVLIDRGELDPDAPVARYWPEFAQNGKEGVLVRHVLGHTSGVAGWSEPLSVEDLCDVEKSTAMLARQAPWWKPGTALGYHAFSTGHMVNALTSRITGRTLGQFFAEEICAPLGPDADFHIGTGPECDDRISPLIMGNPAADPSEHNDFARMALFNPLITPVISRTVPWRRAEIGGANGHGNARAAALIQSVVANGGEVGGVRLLSEKTCALAVQEQGSGMDLIMDAPLSWGMGYCTGSPLLEQLFGPRIVGHRIAFWGGGGGSMVVADLDARMTVAYVMNRWLAGSFDARSCGIVKASYEAIG